MKAIGLIFSVVIVTILMRYLTLSSSKNADEYKMGKAERFVLKYNKAYGIVGVICFLAAGIYAMLEFSGMMVSASGTGIISSICTIAICLIFGITIILSVNNIKIEVSEDKIKHWNFFKMTKEISWDDIKKVECVNNYRELKLITDKNSIRVHTQMVGFSAFDTRMRKKIDRSIYIDAVKKLRVI